MSRILPFPRGRIVETPNDLLTLTLRNAVDDYAGFLTGDRAALHMKDFRELPSKGRSHDREHDWPPLTMRYSAYP